MENFERITKLEEDLGLPKGFLNEVFKESDWSLIIKLHALIETALTQSLIAVINRPEIEDFITRLNISGRNGKLALGKSFRIIDTHDCNFIKGLSAIRNMAAHNIKNVNLDLRKHFRSLKKDEKNCFLEALSLKPKMKVGEETAEQILVNQPHLVIYIGSVLLLSDIFGHKQSAMRARMVRDLTESFARGNLGFGLKK